MPCISLNSTICVRVSATPHNMDAIVKPTRQTMNSGLRPKRADIQPTGAVMMAAATM